MGIINWMQSRFNRKTENRSFDGAAAVRSPRRAGVQDSCNQVMYEAEKHLNAEQWPQASLLSIGTLGNDVPPLLGDRGVVQEQDLPEFTVEEVKKLQDALARLLRRDKSKSSGRGSGAGAGGEDSPPLDRFLNCPSSLEVDRRARHKHADGDGDLSPDTRIILTRARDLLDNGCGRIKRKSFRFLLKKMFVCSGGFPAPARSLKDPVDSRMEKFLQTVLGRKINVRRPSNAAALPRKHFLEDGPKGKRRGGDGHGGSEEGEGEEASCRWEWDRTDSEFIVLEI